MRKYNVIIVAQDYTTTISGGPFLEYRDALEYVNEIINSEYKGEKESYYKVYMECKNIITVYSLGYLSKSLHSKYIILDYEDDTDCDCPNCDY